MENEHPTPRFGNNIDDNKIPVKFVSQSIRKVSSGSNKYEEKKEKYKSVEGKNKSKNKGGHKNNSNEKIKNKIKNKKHSKNKHKSSKSKNKNISEVPPPVMQEYGNLFDNFLKKRIKLNNYFDQSNTDKFLLEKELAFQQFLIKENADSLDN